MWDRLVRYIKGENLSTASACSLAAEKPKFWDKLSNIFIGKEAVAAPDCAEICYPEDLNDSNGDAKCEAAYGQGWTMVPGSGIDDGACWDQLDCGSGAGSCGSTYSQYCYTGYRRIACQKTNDGSEVLKDKIIFKIDSGLNENTTGLIEEP